MQLRGRGYRLDASDPDAWTTGRLLGSRRSVATPLVATLEHFVRHAYNQRTTSSCVGWALAMAIFIRLRAMGFDPIFPSPSAIYKNARALARMSRDEPLEDTGCQPGKAIRGARLFGVANIEEAPFDPATINEDLELGLLELAHEFLLTGYYRINSTGKDASEDTCQALAAQYPIIGGTQADHAFDVYDGTTILNAPDPMVIDEGHMIVILGFKTMNGKRCFRGVNSWGPDPRYVDEPSNRWGDNGFFWCTEAYVQALTDKFVITVDKRPT